MNSHTEEIHALEAAIEAARRSGDMALANGLQPLLERELAKDAVKRDEAIRMFGEIRLTGGAARYAQKLGSHSVAIPDGGTAEIADVIDYMSAMLDAMKRVPNIPDMVPMMQLAVDDGRIVLSAREGATNADELGATATPAPSQPRSAPQSGYGGRRRREDTGPILERKGILAPGTKLALLVEHLPRVAAADLEPDDDRCQAVWDQHRMVRWKGDGRRDTLSALTRYIRDVHGIPLPLGEINGFRYWGLTDDTSRRSLWEIGEEHR